MKFPELSDIQIEQIAKTLGDTEKGFTGREIGDLLNKCGIADVGEGLTKWKRLCAAFDEIVREYNGNTNHIYEFIKKCFDPALGLKDSDNYNWRRLEINKILMLVGIEIRDNGDFYLIEKADSLSEVQRRTKDLQRKLNGYGAHREVLKCCREELLEENYFHAVFEAAKSLSNRLREMSGLNLDGVQLIERVFSSNDPYIAINQLSTQSEKNQQKGLMQLLLGVNSMVRNVNAHELKINWAVNEADAVDILTEISYLHKLLDQCIIIPRIN